MLISCTSCGDVKVEVEVQSACWSCKVSPVGGPWTACALSIPDSIETALDKDWNIVSRCVVTAVAEGELRESSPARHLEAVSALMRLLLPTHRCLCLCLSFCWVSELLLSLLRRIATSLNAFSLLFFLSWSLEEEEEEEEEVDEEKEEEKDGGSARSISCKYCLQPYIPFASPHISSADSDSLSLPFHAATVAGRIEEGALSSREPSDDLFKYCK